MATSPETAASQAAAGPAAPAVAALGNAIAAVPLRGVTGTLCRAVRAKHLTQKQPPEPLYYLASARTGARFTPVGGPAGLYLASDQPTAFAEIGDLRYDATGRRLPIEEPEDGVALVYARTILRGVLDLADDAVCRQVGVTPEQVRGEWRAPMEAYLAGRGPLPLTQQIGQAAHLTGRVRGIWFRSAREAGGSCLCVFPDRLAAADGDLLVVRGSYPQRLP